MKLTSPLTFPNPVNEVSARLVAGGVVVLSALTIALDERWLTAVIAYGCLARALAGPTLSPLGQLGGSMCGGAGIDMKVCSTVGFERRHNPTLAIVDRDEFVARAIAMLGPQPPNFERIVALNRGALVTSGVEVPALYPLVQLRVWLEARVAGRPPAGDRVHRPRRRRRPARRQARAGGRSPKHRRPARRRHDQLAPGTPPRRPHPTRPIAVICAAGARAATAASLLKRHGARDVVHVVDGGVPALADNGQELVPGRVV
jgi:rhodanese-related sulfurtransferase